MISFLKLIRYKNLLMVLLTMVLTKYALIHSYISTSSFSDFHFIILSISVLCITASGYIINDIFDIETDKINKPSRLIIGNYITVKNSYIFYFSLILIGFFTGIYLSLVKESVRYVSIFVFTILGLYLYSKYLKRLLLIGNIFTSLFVALTILIVFIFETIDIEKPISFLEAFKNLFESISISLAILTYLFFAFTITLIREIIKDIEDTKGDYAVKMKTLPILFGLKRTKYVVISISSVVFVFILFTLKEIIDFPLLFGYSIVLIAIPFAWFIYQLWNAHKTKHFHQLSQVLKLIMFFGILSMLLFKFQ